MTLRALIIDDEQSSRETLKTILSEYCPDVELAGMADSVESGIQSIAECKPNVVFLDIQMPYANGFDLLQAIDDRSFEVIFTTAYDRYAMQAFKVSAIDYLLKPIDADELQAAVKQAYRRLAAHSAPTGALDTSPSPATPTTNEQAPPVQEQLRTFLKNITDTSLIEKIALPVAGGMEFVPLRNIIRCEAVANYTRVHLVGKAPLLISHTLKDFERRLPAHSFVRLHHSHLVNIEYIVRYLRNEGGQVVLSDGSVVDVARRKRDELLEHLNRQGLRIL